MLIPILIQQPALLPTVLHQTPTWVWVLLAALTALGASQMAARRAGRLRATLMPAAMAGLALYGLLTAFGSAAQGAIAASTWLLAAWVSTVAIAWRWPQPPQGTRYDPATDSFALPGSVIPMLLIMGIFLVKYVVAIELAVRPERATDAGFVVAVAALYGLFNGIFAARFIRLLRLARQERTGAMATTGQEPATRIEATP